MATIGFIGLGHMGLPMAINLVKAGHQVCGFDLQPTAMELLVAAGGSAATTALQLAKEKDVIITMLQTGEQVENLCLGEQGLLKTASPHTLFIDCSSIAVQSARRVHEQAEELGLLSLDAPVSGGVAGAGAGTLTFMVGGKDDAFVLAESYLKIMGQKIIRTGDAGSGQAAKICNNMILGVSMVAISEAFTLAKALGLAPEKLFEVVNNASGQCWAMSKYVPVPGLLEQVPANDDYKPGFTAKMMLKDLSLSQDSAQKEGLVTPIAATTTALYQRFVDMGQGDLDFSAIIKAISNSS
jgi:3-hydroxyisobutyrate dehydrogenase